MAFVAWRVHITAGQLNQNQKLGFPTRVAWRLGVHREAVSLQKPRKGKNDMSRMTAMNSPPGDFWKISRNPETINSMKVMHTIHITIYIKQVHT